METHCKELRAQNIETVALMPTGEPCEQVLMEIENGDYDLVAMAVHGHTLAGDILFGSVSESLKHKISIPLLLLKPDHLSSIKPTDPSHPVKKNGKKLFGT